MSSAIAKEGIKLANSVGTTTKEDFETLNNQIALNVQNHYETAMEELKTVVEKAVEEISQEVKKVLQSNLAKTFITCFVVSVRSTFFSATRTLQTFIIYAVLLTFDTQTSNSPLPTIWN